MSSPSPPPSPKPSFRSRIGTLMRRSSTGLDLETLHELGLRTSLSDSSTKGTNLKVVTTLGPPIAPHTIVSPVAQSPAREAEASRPFAPPPRPSSSSSINSNSSLSSPAHLVERQSRKGGGDYIKRPESAFILFRRKYIEERRDVESPEDGRGGLLAPGKKQRQAGLSNTISQRWRNLSPEERQRWEDLAKTKKREHEQMYPNYNYRPQISRAAKVPTEGKQDSLACSVADEGHV